MQNNTNQTNQKDSDNMGQNELRDISTDLCSIWLGEGFEPALARLLILTHALGMYILVYTRRTQ